jgi:hypothetical protein
MTTDTETNHAKVTTEPEAPAANVIAALARVRRDLPGIGKNQRMSSPSGSYDYRGIEDVTSAVGPLCGRHGVVFVPRVVKREVEEISLNGKPWTVDVVTVQYTIYGPGGIDDQIAAGPFIGIGRDNSDKGVNKSLTQAFKQMLQQVFVVGDSASDPDSYGAVDRDPRPAPPSADELAERDGWHSVNDRDVARTQVREELNSRVLAHLLEHERAAELYRHYQRPDGFESQPRPRTYDEHLAFWREHIAPPEDNPIDSKPEPGYVAPAESADPTTTEAPVAPGAPDGPTTAPEPLPATASQPAWPAGSLEALYATSGTDALIDAIKTLDGDTLRTELDARRLDVGGNLGLLRQRLGQAVIQAVANR